MLHIICSAEISNDVPPNSSPRPSRVVKEGRESSITSPSPTSVSPTDNFELSSDEPIARIPGEMDTPGFAALGGIGNAWSATVKKLMSDGDQV